MILYWSFTNPFVPAQKGELTEISVTLKEDITILQGFRKANIARFYTKEHRCRFVVGKGGGMASDEALLESLSASDEIQILVRKRSVKLLEDKGKRILIFAMKKGERTVFNLENMNRCSLEYDKRSTFFQRFFAIMLLLNGFDIIRKGANITIIVLFIALVMAMKILEFGLY